MNDKLKAALARPFRAESARILLVPGLAALGLADSAYLSVTHLAGELPACGGYAGCAEVNSSPYAFVFGLPIAYIGSALYLTVLGIALWRTGATGAARAQGTLLLYGLLLAGATFMAYLTAVEFFVLRAVCYWCLALAAITFVLLALSGREAWRLGVGPANPPPLRPRLRQAR